MQQSNLKTVRLTLRPFTLDDVPSVTALVNDKAIASTTLRIPYPYDESMAEEWIGSHQSRLILETGIVFALEISQNRQLAGSIGLSIDKEHARAEIGYWIGKPFWNKGYATEAAGALIALGFDKLELNRIYASHLVRNPASGRVMEKNGLKFEGCLRQHVNKWGIYEDLNLYSILREEHLKD